MIRILEPTPEHLADAAAALAAGKLVAFPTETVYGLGGDARNPEAVRRIFVAKGRPADHPLIVHLPSAAALEAWAVDVPEGAHLLAAHFWPGPLTLVLRRRPEVPDVVTGGQPTIALRVPGHPVAQALLAAAGFGVAAPSANRFGHISPTTAQHVFEEFAELPECGLDIILDGGPCEVGLESTIVDLSGDRPQLLRPGAISAESLAEVLGEPVIEAGRDAPRAPGRLARHYAPQARAKLVGPAELERVANAAGAAAGSGSRPVAVLARRAAPPSFAGVWLELPDEPSGYGRRLYAALRELDALEPACIVIEAVPATPAWRAVRDRLQRATATADAVSSGEAAAWEEAT